MRYRLAAVFAGLALVVALVSGSAAGLSFVTVLIRALAGAVVFAGLGLGTVAVLQRFLPELFAGAQAAEAPQAAAAVDIVLPEENPLAGEFADEQEQDGEAGAAPLEAADPELSERPQADDGAAAPAAGEEAARAAVDDVEALPSLDGLDVEPRDSTALGAPPGRRSGRAGAADVNADPTLAARALRTWLKRDHEG